MSVDIENEFYEALSMNREIEFNYKGNIYALVYHQEGWCLVNREKNLSNYYSGNQELLNHIEFDGKNIKDLIKENAISIEAIY